MKQIIALLATLLVLMLAWPLAGAELVLTWTDNSDNEAGFVIERRTGTEPFAAVATVGANVTRYVDTQLAEDTAYTYRVAAYNSRGPSDYSNEAGATTIADQAPAAPSAPKVAPEPSYQPPILATLQPGQALLVVAANPTPATP